MADSDEPSTQLANWRRLVCLPRTGACNEPKGRMYGTWVAGMVALHVAASAAELGARTKCDLWERNPQ
jgi:hypothetical protein